MSQERSEVTRRVVLRSAAVAGAGIPLLAACGGDDGAGGPTDGTTPSGSGQAGASAGADGRLVATSDVPVGGGTILEDERVVLTQPTAGEFKAFTAVCTHQGCIVSSVSDGTINCPCHGSMFSIEDGSVVGGPAPSPLAEVQVTVEGGQITVG